MCLQLCVCLVSQHRCTDVMILASALGVSKINIHSVPFPVKFLKRGAQHFGVKLKNALFQQ